MKGQLGKVTTRFGRGLAVFIVILLLAAASIMHLAQAQSAPSIWIEMSSHFVPMDTPITGTVTLYNLAPDSYSSVIFRADITPYNKGERRCNGDDTGRDIEIAVDESSETFTADIYDACPTEYHSYGTYTLDLSISRVDATAPGGKVELATARTQFGMSRYLTIGEPTATPPDPDAVAWMDPDPRTQNMRVNAEWQEFRFRSDVTRYLNDHLGVVMNGGIPGQFASLPGSNDPPSVSVEQACRDWDLHQWRRAIHQSLWVGACKSGEAVILLMHETDAGPPLYEYRFDTVSDGSPAATPTPTATITPTPAPTVMPTPRPNSPATGLPTISGTAQVGETLTADISGIGDDDGLDNATFSYQWIAGTTDISGATGSSYAPLVADLDKTIKVRVSFDDDRNFLETLTSEATATVIAVVTPLTAEFQDAPDKHDGTGFFTFKIAFSEPISIGYVTLRDDSLDVTNGSATKGKRVNGQSDLWEITVEPDSDADVTVVLPVTEDCAAQDAVCTRDGTKLSNRSELTVPGPAAANSPATGAPIISGTARVGETLTVDTSGIDDADGIGNATFSYQWIAGTTDISGATGSTYAPLVADLGKTIKVRVSFDDDQNNFESLTSAATAAVAAKPNSPATGAPTISGTAQVGKTLRADISGIADADGMSGAVFSYQWLANEVNIDTDISGATDPTYTLVADDLGKAIRVRVSFMDGASNVETLTSEATATVVTPLTAEFQDAPDKHDGTGVFTFLIAFSEPISISYKTLRDDSLEVTNGSATKAKRVNGQSDRWEITVEPDSDADVTVVLPITEDCTAQDAVCTRDGKKLSNRSELTVPGPAAANSPATGAPIISGTARVGETLTVDTSAIDDADGMSGAVFSYQWLADGVDIVGATGDTYTLVEADFDKAVKVRVIFTDNDDNEETLTSEATAAVEPRPNSPATGAPTISGTVRVGETLTVDTSGIDDADGMSGAVFSYQWLANDAEITGATGDTYTLVEADFDKAVKVRVIFNDDDDSEEQLTSAATAAVEAKPNSPATGAPTISGTARVGEILTAHTSDIADPDGLNNVGYNFNWGAGDYLRVMGDYNTYRVQARDVGLTIKVWVGFTDEEGNLEILTSVDTVAVVATTPAAPQHLNVSHHGTGALDLSWEAPIADWMGEIDGKGTHGDGGSPITGYKVQWKSGSEDYDGSAGSTRQAEITDPASRTHTIIGLTDGVEYAVRVIAVNDVGDGPPSVEATGTPRETTPPELSTATVDGTTLTLTYDEDLDEASGLAADAFSVTVGGTGRAVDGVSVSGSSVILTLGSAVASGATVMVSYTVPTDAAAPHIQDEAGNPAASFSDEDVENNTPPPANTPATGAPSISGTAQVGDTLTASTSDIDDADGMSKAVFSYQWLANGAEIAGATSDTYTPVADDVGKAIKVKVSFRDDKNHQETLTSEATAAVATAADESSIWSATLTVGSIGGFRGFWEDWTGSLAPDGFNIDGSDYTVISLINYSDLMFVFVLDRALPGDFTLQVGETTFRSEEAGVDTSPSSYTYQWQNKMPDLSDGDTVQIGLTLATDPAYTLVEDDEGNAIRVQVSFTDDDYNPEELTSEAAAAVEPASLTTETSDEPESHNGTDAFTLSIAFSEDISISDTVFRDHSFESTNGSITRARRVNGSSSLWEITVEPDSDADVTVVLPVTTDCAAQGAVCTSDGRKLSNSVELTVAGPRGSGEGAVYTYEDSDRTLRVILQEDLVVRQTGSDVPTDRMVRRTAGGSIVRSHFLYGAADLPVFRSPSGGGLMTLPGGVLLALDPEWDEARVERFFVENNIAQALISERDYMPNGFFVDTEPGFPSLELANTLAAQKGVVLSIPNWWLEFEVQKDPGQTGGKDRKAVPVSGDIEPRNHDFDNAWDLPLDGSYSESIDPARDNDYFKLDLSGQSGPTDVRIYTTGDTDTYGKLYKDDKETVLLVNDDIDFPDNTNFQLVSSLEPGIYYVVVRGYDDTTGDYTIHAKTVTATALSLGFSVDANIDTAREVDYFRLDLSGQSGNTDVSLFAVSSDWEPGIEASFGSWHRLGNSNFLGDVTFLVHGSAEGLAAVSHLFAVVSEMGTGSYTLRAQAVPDHGSTTDDATTLSLVAPTSGKLTSASDAEYFKLVLGEPRALVIMAFAVDGVDAVMLDSDGNPIQVNIETGAGFNRINDDFESGTYYVKITATGASSYALYAYEEAYKTGCIADTIALADPTLNDPLYACQWHLNSADAADMDINVESVWDDSIMGEGINVVVVDETIDYSHPDLIDNIDISLNHDYGIGYIPSENHGTNVAGVIAARDNTIGVRGVAPMATIYGYNLFAGGGFTYGDMADAMSRDRGVTAVSNNSWGWLEGNGFFPVVAPFEMAIDTGVTEGYYGKGVFYVFIGGNGGGPEHGDNSNRGEVGNYYGVTAVCAVGENGRRATYSEEGANLWICAPTWGDADGDGLFEDDDRGTATTKNSGYRGAFNGTSAAAPMVSGVAALLRQANPGLTWRDLKLILAASAQRIDSADTGWEDGADKYDSTDGAESYHFNHQYGFGIVDAAEAVALAQDWRNLPPFLDASSESSTPDTMIPDNTASGITRSLTLDTEIGFIEFVEVEVSIDHVNWRELKIELVSPSGATSLLAVSDSTATDVRLSLKFRFGSAKHLGEDPNGTWMLKVVDEESGNSGTFKDWSITVYGHGSVRAVSTGLTTATATVWLPNPDAESLTVYLRHSNDDGNTWSTPVAQITTGTLVDFDLTGLAPNAEYKLQASWDGTFADGNEVGADFINRPAQRDIDTLLGAGNDSPYGIWSDGTTMWVGDYVGDKLYAYTLATGERDADKDFNTLAVAGNDGPTGIWSDGVTMWVADNSDDRLYAYTLATGSWDAGKDIATLAAAGNDDPTGLWSDGTTMWVADFVDDKLYAYTLATGTRDADKDFNTLAAAGNNAPSGIWSDGATMWVADFDESKLYAYKMSDKARDSGRDFDTLDAAGNDERLGIWSDGATIWVADNGDDKLYSYYMPANNAPVFSEGSNTTRTVAENTAAGQNIGARVAANGADNDTLTYSLGGADSASFDIVTTTGQLKTSAALDYEDDTSHSVTVSVSDGNGGADTIAVTISVTDVNEKPATPATPTVTWSKNGGADGDLEHDRQPVGELDGAGAQRRAGAHGLRGALPDQRQLERLVPHRHGHERDDHGAHGEHHLRRAGAGAQRGDAQRLVDDHGARSTGRCGRTGRRDPGHGSTGPRRTARRSSARGPTRPARWRRTPPQDRTSGREWQPTTPTTTR